MPVDLATFCLPTLSNRCICSIVSWPVESHWLMSVPPYSLMNAPIAALKAAAGSRCIMAAVLVLMATELGCSNTANASCGDYLVHHGSSPSHQPQDELTAKERSSSEPALPTKRCSGPNCSSSPLAPSTPASPVFLKYRVEYAVVPLYRPWSDQHEECLRQSSEPAASNDPAEIFRPPKIG